MHLFLTDRGNEPFLIWELERAFRGCRAGLRAPGLLASDFVLQTEAPPTLVFARQILPDAQSAQAASINEWSTRLFDRAANQLPENQPWHLHVLAQYGNEAAGQNRCRLIRASLLERLHLHRRVLLRTLVKEPVVFGPASSILQLLLTAPDAGFISVAPAPAPHQLRRILWPFPGGTIPWAIDKAAPSRAFAKLVEAQQRLGRWIGADDQCVDLGAAPGSWSYSALRTGARVIAVDRAPLRSDLMSNPRLVFRKGDAFTYEPDKRVDWLLCDVIAAPERSVELLLRWLRRKLARYFVVTIKFKGSEEYPILEQLKHALPSLCTEFCLTHLSANRNEVCAFGTVAEGLTKKRLSALPPPGASERP